MVRDPRFILGCLLVVLTLLSTSRLNARDSFELLGRQFDSSSEGASEALTEFAAEQIARYETQKEAHDRTQEKIKEHGKLKDLPAALLWDYRHPPKDHLIKRDRRGLRAIVERCEALDTAAPGERAVLWREITELAVAVNNNHRPMVEPVEMLWGPVLFAQSLRNGIGGGDSPAVNVSSEDDEGLMDPPASSFWARPPDIASANLYAGFGRARLPDYSEKVWKYDGPKTSSGANPGFDLIHDDEKLEVKLFEAYSDPFATRIFHALGYHVNFMDHAAMLKVRYHRRVFREFNLRAPIYLRIRLLGIPHYRQNLQEYRDPFDYLLAAQLVDGTRLSPGELKARLFHDTERERPESDPKNFNVAFEDQIDRLEFGPFDVQPDVPDIGSVGPWDYAELGHDDLREVRAMGVIAGWLAYWDARWDNTRLKLRETSDGTELLHMVTDLGGGLGRAEPYYGWGPELPDEFTWHFTEPPIVRGPGRMTTPFRFVHFHTSRDNRAYQAMTEADARWGTRLLARLTEPQIAAALIASGYDSATARLYLEKLVARRDRLVTDIGLANEVGLLRDTPPDRHFNYDPQSDGPFTAKLPDGEIVSAPVGEFVIVNGRRVSRP